MMLLLLNSTRFNAALIFFLTCYRISSSVHWSNKDYRWSISLYMSSFMAALVVYSPKTFTSQNISSFPTLTDLIGTFEGSTGIWFRWKLIYLITRWMCLHMVTLRRESEHVHVYLCIPTLCSLHRIWQFWHIVCCFLIV